MIKYKIFPDREMPEISYYIEDIDISTLDGNHVRSNIGNIFQRGIWFPLGFDDHGIARG